MAAAAIGLCSISGPVTAAVTPVTLIDRQVVKPNMLILFDTSTSMMNVPGGKDIDSNEAGPDCEEGNDKCRPVGQIGRCYYAGTGAMGAGVTNDRTQCHTDAECRTGYCKGNKPKFCADDSECTGGATCKGFCADNNSLACSKNADCLGSQRCQGVCTNAGGTRCTSDAECPVGDYCTVYPNDFCVSTADKLSRVKMCQVGQNRCQSNADCTSYPGDTCTIASSRIIVAKRTVAGIISSYYKMVNFGLMSFYQSSYYPYYETSGSITDHPILRFLDRDQLSALDCWTKGEGPRSSCTINGRTFNRRGTSDSRYKVRTGGDSYTYVESGWCGVWCDLAASGGTGYYQGSYYEATEPRAAIANLTPIYKSSYLGKTLQENGKNYIYWNPPASMRNDGGVYGAYGSPLPIDAGDRQNYCCATCGGRADSLVAPFMDTSNDPVRIRSSALAMIARMDKVGFGGLAPEGSTPIGCTLSFGGSAEASDTNNALSYMLKVKSTDPAPCRLNYVLLVTDGQPNYPGDTLCNSAACNADDPAAAGCTCRSVLAARDLKLAGIKTYVVGFSEGTTSAYTRATLDNIAKAGGSTRAYAAIREQELEYAIIDAIYDAARGSYSTSPAASSSGIQTPNSIELGNLLLDTRVDFPGWKGNLIAYDTSGPTPVVAWNAATVSFDPAPTAAGPDFWKKRQIWTSNGSSMVKFDVDPVTGAINNRAALKALGLGSTEAEAERAARWLLGDPAMKNPAVLGAIINSTPIDVGPPGLSSLPGGKAFYDTHSGRPHLTYVGSSDGMLHAFFTKPVTVGSNPYRAGQEAFAYIPQSLLHVVTKLYAQGGQLPDPKDHIYGLANSPKVKNLCTRYCDGSGTPEWKTVLVMTYGWGGTEAFMLDVTNPFDSTGVRTSSAPAPLIWHTQYMSRSTTSAYDNSLGLTTSVPAFYYGKGSTKDDFRLIFGSYATDEMTGQVGKVLINSSTKTGGLIDAPKISPPGSCVQDFGLMSDVATARNYNLSEEMQILAAYMGDTWGNLYRYVPDVGVSGTTMNKGTVSIVEPLGCTHPIHYAPTIVQLDRDMRTNRPGEIYIVQVTNSALDHETKDFPASKMIFRKDIGIGGAVTPDTSFGVGGKIELTAGAELCGVTDASGSSCLEVLPPTARPNSTPIAILRQDGQGFQIFATFYVPTSTSCNKGVTYFTIHGLDVQTGVTQKFGMKLASEPVTSTVFVAGKLMFAKQSGVVDLTPILPPTVRFSLGGGSGERFQRTSWSELP